MVSMNAARLRIAERAEATRDLGEVGAGLQTQQADRPADGLAGRQDPRDG